MDLSKYQITEIRSSDGIYKLGHPCIINDEGYFYRIASTYIYDKNKIKSIESKDNKLIFHMNDEDVVFTVQVKR